MVVAAVTLMKVKDGILEPQCSFENKGKENAKPFHQGQRNPDNNHQGDELPPDGLE